MATDTILGQGWASLGFDGAEVAGGLRGIGVKELAGYLGTEPRSLRLFLRRTQRAVGRGARYSWPSLKAPEVRKIVADFKAAQAKDAQPVAAGPEKPEAK